MSISCMLGIDAGGTHTDAALLAPDARGALRLLAVAKVRTRHDDLPASVREVLAELARALGSDAAARFAGVRRVTLGATLAVNALVQGKADRVGLALSAGPGLNPRRFSMGEHVCVVPGGLDHRGAEVSPLLTEALARAAASWREQGVAVAACVGRFSPRNPAHELSMDATVARTGGMPVTLGHRLSGRLNFPRRLATAYFNAAVQRLHTAFLDAVEGALAGAGITASVRLLKADGGAVPVALSRQEPVRSILSGPAASVMGVLALCPEAEAGCSLLLDMGGTTTDLALLAEGSPVVDRDGMLLQRRRTLVRALATVSIGVGGDSHLGVRGTGAGAAVRVGPQREGPAASFGGVRATLLDAFNVCNTAEGGPTAGDAAASAAALAVLAGACGAEPLALARQAVADALDQVAAAAAGLTEQVNARPIYTLAALKRVHEARPAAVWLVGGPAACVGARLEARLGLPVSIPPHADVANAVGAALTLPTDGLELYADTGRGLLRAPALEYQERIGRSFSLEAARERACQLLQARLADAGVPDARVEVSEAELFATLDDGGFGSKDMRVSCQVTPGIAGRLAE